MVSLQHLPFVVSTDVETGLILISQPMSLGDPDDRISITISPDQAEQLGRHLISMNKTEPAPAGTADHFDEFWSLYPAKRRIDKTSCRLKWLRRKLDDKVGIILPHLRAMLDSEAWKKDGGQFVPMSTTYINQSRWEAEAEASNKPWTIPTV